MAVQPPSFGGRKDLTDAMAGRQHLTEGAKAADLWRREANEREALEHPLREKLLYWIVIAILIVIGLGALTFFVVYFFTSFGGA